MATVRVHEVHPAGAPHADDHADHHGHVVGTMDTTSHERAFDGFVRLLTWNVVAIVVVLIFLALTNA